MARRTPPTTGAELLARRKKTARKFQITVDVSINEFVPGVTKPSDVASLMRDILKHDYWRFDRVLGVKARSTR